MAAKRTPKNHAELRRILDQVMIRNRREEGEIRFTERIVHPLIVTLGPKEQEIYKRVTEFTPGAAHGARQHAAPDHFAAGSMLNFSGHRPHAGENAGGAIPR